MTGLEKYIAEIVLAGFFGTIATLFGLLRYFGKAYLDKSEERFRELGDGFRGLESRLNALQIDLPNKYVQREDWIRMSTTIDSKMDSVNGKLDRLREDIHNAGR